MSPDYRLCYISRNYRGTESAGNKAKTDNEDTLMSAGATNLGLKRSYYRSKILTFFLDLAGIIKFMFCVRANDIILLQYPVKKYFSFICWTAHLRHARTLAVIHDLGSFRRKKLTVPQEVARLMNADYVIASNDVMRQWLQSVGFTKPIGSLGLFDYHSPAWNSPTQELTNSETHTPTIVYAGGLSLRKNAFIIKLSEQTLPCQFHIYGNPKNLPGIKDNPNLSFHNFVPADQFIQNINANYGLVWDGDSLTTCSGNFGQYLRYNSPHKASFYIRAGLPLIVWDQAAIAPIVKEYQIGLCISSLLEISDILNAVTKEQYTAMRNNSAKVARMLDKGHFLLQSIEAVVNVQTCLIV